jgi:hypothetical protein
MENKRKFEVSPEILDNEFNVYCRLAENLIKKMRKSEDRIIAEKYIRACFGMKNSDQLKVKMHRNRFFRFFLKSMRKTVELQTPIYVKKGPNEGGTNEEISDKEFRQWSANHKSYVSAKVIPGFGTLIYMACSDKAGENLWDKRGFAHFPPENIVENTNNPRSQAQN